jgi:hypothetical protein|nr:MAG TPA: hypothetical protein [Caudoviricetes sp.]
MTKDDAIEIIKDVTWKDFGRHPDFPEAREAAIQALNEVEEYRAIGTPEECRAAVEKQTAKLVIDNTPTEDSVWYQCPTCKGDLTTIRGFYCQYCGQKLHWR